MKRYSKRKKNETLETSAEFVLDKKASTLEVNMKKRKKVIRTLITISVFASLIGLGFLILKWTGILDKLDTPEELKELILQGGMWSVLVFFLLQFLQVTFIPLPAIITTIAGTLIFGAVQAFFISYISIMLGSLFAFYLGRKLGKPLLNWMVGEDESLKWQDKLSKGKYVFFFMMLFPFFPDDILCIVAGVTKMTYKFFIVTNVVTRLINVFCMCFITSGTIIPFSGWGIPVWVLLITSCAVLFYLCVRYQTQIEDYITKLSNKIARRKKKQK